MRFCEDYPCCGHTTEDPCAPQWYDRPGNEHALCDHENGECEVYDDDDSEAVSSPRMEAIAYAEREQSRGYR